MGEADLTWSTLLFTAGSLQDFWAQAPATAWKLDDGNYGGRCAPGTMGFVLKPGEELVRPWDNCGKWIKLFSHADFGPHHVCGAADEHDPVNFKYFEPYLKENYGHARKCYRYFGNGWLEWKPDINRGGAKAFCKLDNLEQDEEGVFEVQGDGGTGALAIPLKTPYAGVELELDLLLVQKGGGSSTRVLLVEGGKPKEVWRKGGDAEGLQKIVIPHDRGAFFEGELRIEGKRAAAGGRVALAPRRLRTTFMENIFALPALVPGKNVVTVSAAGPVRLAANKLVVVYEWAEGEGWKTEKSVTREFTELPAAFEVEVAGPRMPRMKRLTMRLSPLGKTDGPNQRLEKQPANESKPRVRAPDLAIEAAKNAKGETSFTLKRGQDTLSTGSLEALRKALAAETRSADDRKLGRPVVVVSASPDTPFKNVMQAVDACAAAGVSGVEFKPPAPTSKE
jgi:biopolymer transport protein ExbD